MRLNKDNIDTVLEVAARLFAERGYGDVGVRLIAAESGIKVPSIYYHFGSKALLFEEILERRWNVIFKEIELQASYLHNTDEKLECLLSVMMEQMFRDRVLLLLLQRGIVEAAAGKLNVGSDNSNHPLFSSITALLERIFPLPEDRRIALWLGSMVPGYCTMATLARAKDFNHHPDSWFMAECAKMAAVMVAVGRRVRTNSAQELEVNICC